MTQADWQRKVRERLEEKQKSSNGGKNGHVADEYADVIPEDPRSAFLTDEQKSRDAFLEANCDIVTAYRMWCGKMVPDTSRGKTESIMISCPIPGHADRNPSAWINTDKNTWYCAGCDQGGDAMDIAALNLGYPSTYKTDGSYTQLREEMAAQLGFVYQPGLGATPVVPLDERVEEESEDDDNVVPISPEFRIIPVTDSTLIEDIDFKLLAPKNTFLDVYMRQCSVDDASNEYHFWNGLMAVGLAIGRDVRLKDSLPVLGNLFICTLGNTGQGKSKAKSHLNRLLTAALPYDDQNPFSKGVKRIKSPGSGESLVKSFDAPIYDPSNPKKLVGRGAVRGIIEYNELSALAGRSDRIGSTIKPELMAFYDGEDHIGTTSLTTGSKVAEMPFASCHTTSQLQSLRGLLRKSDETSGFLNRWLFVLGKPKKRIAIGGTSVDINPAVKPLQEIHGWAGSFTTSEYMTWTPEGAQELTEFFEEVVYPLQEEDAYILSRIDLLYKKIVLLVSANKMEQAVTADTVRAVRTLHPYIMQCYGKPATQIARNESDDLQELILKFVETQPRRKGATVRDISRAAHRKNYKRDEIAAACKVLAVLGELELFNRNEGKPGRPAHAYRLAGGE